MGDKIIKFPLFRGGPLESLKAPLRLWPVREGQLRNPDAPDFAQRRRNLDQITGGHGGLENPDISDGPEGPDIA